VAYDSERERKRYAEDAEYRARRSATNRASRKRQGNCQCAVPKEVRQLSQRLQALAHARVVKAGQGDVQALKEVFDRAGRTLRAPAHSAPRQLTLSWKNPPPSKKAATKSRAGNSSPPTSGSARTTTAAAAPAKQ
jgi:hypothetical protein